jgi:hypothetical protein
MGKTLVTPDIDGTIILKRPLRTLYWANSDRVSEGAIVTTEISVVSYKMRDLLTN